MKKEKDELKEKNEEIEKETVEEVEEVEEIKDEIKEKDKEEVVEEENDKEEEKEEKEEVSKRPVHPEKKNNTVLVIMLLLVIACIGLCVYFLGNGKNKDIKDSNNDNKKEAEVKKQDYKSEYRLSGNGLENFDLYFLQLENKEVNKVYSPLSIKYALEMLAEGADGDSKKQLDAIIGDYVAKKYTNSKNMSFANAFFVKDTFKESIKKDYIDKLTSKYNAEVVYDGFKDPTTINNWVSEKTLKLIPSLVDDVSSNDFFLINALAIDMEWVKKIQSEHEDYEVKFEHEKVIDKNSENEWERENGVRGVYVSSLDGVGYHKLNYKDFKAGAKSVEIAAVANKYDIVKELGEDKIRETVQNEFNNWLKEQEAEAKKGGYKLTEEEKKFDMDSYIRELDSNYKHMSSSTDFLFYDDNDVKVFAKDLKEYDGKTLQYVGIMPKEEKLVDFIKNTNSSKVNEYINSLKDMSLNSFKDGYMTIIEGYIPMFKMDYELDLMGDLKKMGVKDIFDSNKADLSKMTSEKEYIDPAIHKANIEFSNDGIKASAATALGGKGSADGGFNYWFEVPCIKIDLTFDKPYMYLVRDKESGEVWFTGTVYEPVVYEEPEYLPY